MLVQKNYDDFLKLKWLDTFMIGHKGFICGGCFKNIFNDEKVKDIDIFFENAQEWQRAVDWFDERSVGFGFEEEKLTEETAKYRFYYENDNVKAYKHLNTGITIELCCKIFGSAREIIDSFDFTITKFALYKETVTDEDGETHVETKIVCDDMFFEHLHLKRLVIDNEIPFPMSTFERVIRYAKYGYFPCHETKKRLIKAIRELDDEQVEVPENFCRGMD